MKRVIFMTLVMIIAVFSSLQAGQHKAGQFGLGWYSMTAPVGGRVWISEMVGIDLGLGYADKNVVGGDDAHFNLNLGVPIDIVQTEKVNLFVRPGFEFQSDN